MKVQAWIGWRTSADNYTGIMNGYAGGNFYEGMGWQDLLSLFPENTFAYLEALKESVIENNIRFTGVDHQFGEKGVPVFEDGTALYLSQNDWASIMAAIWSHHENKEYSYRDWYGI